MSFSLGRLIVSGGKDLIDYGKTPAQKNKTNRGDEGS